MQASYGHVRDLPESADEIPDEIRKKKWGRLGVDTEGDFKPYYVDPERQAQARAGAEGRRSRAPSRCCSRPTPIAKASRSAGICKEILKPKVPVKRIVFHEITEGRDQRGREGRARRRREPGPRAGKPPHPRSAVRLHAVAGAVEEGADRPERRPRAERRRAPDRRSRRGASRVHGRRPTGISRRVSPATGASSPRRSRASATERVATGKDFDANGALTGKNARVLSEADGRALVDALCGAPAVDGHGGRREARRRASRAAVHDVDAHAGGEPQARVLHRAHHAGRAAAVPGRPHLLPPHRFDDAQREGARRIGGGDSRACSATSTTSGPRRYATKVKNAQEAHEAIRPAEFRRDAGVARSGARSRRSAGLRADLEAHDGVADGRRARAAHDDRDLRRRRQRRDRRCSPPRARRSSSPASAAPTSKAATIRRRSSKSRRPCCPKLTVGERVDARARRRGCTLVGARARSATKRRRRRGTPKRRSSRSSSGSASAGPSTYAATIGTIERRGYVFRQGKALVPELHGVRGHAAAARAFRRSRRRRVHRGDGGGPRPDLARRARVARLHPPVLPRRQASSRARGRGQAGGGARRLSADRRRRRPRIGRARPRPHRPLRSVPAAGRGRTREDGVAAADAGAGRSDGREGDGADSRQGRGAAHCSASIRRPA